MVLARETSLGSVFFFCIFKVPGYLYTNIYKLIDIPLNAIESLLNFMFVRVFMKCFYY